MYCKERPMNPVYTHSLTTFAAFGVAAALLSGCGKSDQASNSASSGSPQNIAAPQGEPSAADPCTLLSATEAEVYVGKLAAPPFRANDDGAANSAGDSCTYRGTGAQQLVIV